MLRNGSGMVQGTVLIGPVAASFETWMAGADAWLFSSLHQPAHHLVRWRPYLELA